MEKLKTNVRVFALATDGQSKDGFLTKLLDASSCAQGRARAPAELHLLELFTGAGAGCHSSCVQGGGGLGPHNQELVFLARETHGLLRSVRSQ